MRAGAYVDVHLPVQAVIQQQVVCHPNAVRLHRVPRAVVVVSDVACGRRAHEGRRAGQRYSARHAARWALLSRACARPGCARGCRRGVAAARAGARRPTCAGGCPHTGRGCPRGPVAVRAPRGLGRERQRAQARRGLRADPLRAGQRPCLAAARGCGHRCGVRGCARAGRAQPRRGVPGVRPRAERQAHPPGRAGGKSLRGGAQCEACGPPRSGPVSRPRAGQGAGGAAAGLTIVEVRHRFLRLARHGWTIDREPAPPGALAVAEARGGSARASSSRAVAARPCARTHAAAPISTLDTQPRDAGGLFRTAWLPAPLCTTRTDGRWDVMPNLYSRLILDRIRASLVDIE